MTTQLTQKIGLTWRNGIRYLPLLKNLISRELKKKYRQSALGYIWCVLNPLLILLILYFVFSKMNDRVENFAVYLCAGRMMFTFVTDCTSAMLGSIAGNSRLMRKTRIPYYVFPLSAMGSAVVNFLFQIVALLIVLLFTGVIPDYHVAAFPLVCLEMFLFRFGLGMILAVAYIFVKDVRYFYAVFTTAWMYLSAIFYTIDKLPPMLRNLVIRFNPAYFYMDMSRAIFYLHQWPSGAMLLRGGVVGIIVTVLGLVMSSRAKKNMILYV